MLAVFVLYALEVLGLSKQGYGVLLTAGGVGALAGSLLARPAEREVGPGTLLIVAVLVIGCGDARARRLVPNPIAVGVALAVFGALGVAWNVVTVSLRQAIVPDALLGRVNSAYRLLGWGTMPIGAAARWCPRRDVRAARPVRRRRRRTARDGRRDDPRG